MWIVARRTMDLSVRAKRQILRHNLRRSDLTIGIGQGPIITKPDATILANCQRVAFVGSDRTSGSLSSGDGITQISMKISEGSCSCSRAWNTNGEYREQWVRC